MFYLIIMFILVGYYFKANINLTFKNDSVWSKADRSVLFQKTN